VGAHRYWRIVPKGTYYTDYVGFAEIKFFDQSNSPISGGTASAYSDKKSKSFIDIPGIIGTDYHAARARDGSNSSKWVCAQGDAARRLVADRFRQREGREVASRCERPRTTTNSRSWRSMSSIPTTARLELRDHLRRPLLGQRSGEHVGHDSLNPDPIDYPTTMSALPPPFTGASTYVGGTITFTTGANTGKTMEITAFDTGTNTITVLEGVPLRDRTGRQVRHHARVRQDVQHLQGLRQPDNFRGEPHVPGRRLLPHLPECRWINFLAPNRSSPKRGLGSIPVGFTKAVRAMASIVRDWCSWSDKRSASRPRTCLATSDRPMASCSASTSSTRRPSSRPRRPGLIGCSGNPIPDPLRHLRRA
jgi:hypothetical protein